jgi:phosphate starvation-inducible PhoH-like protein
MDNNEIFKEKSKPKNPIRFNIHLNDEQKITKDRILNSTISVLGGSAGSGKTILASQIALDLLFKKEIEKIIITRPVVTSGEDIGFLPGSKEDKLAPFTAPVYDNMYRLYDKVKIDKCITEGKIEVVPVAFMRGRNFSNSLIIVDEAQNITHTQMELILSRLCMGSKMIICGDSAQIDLKNRKESGFSFLTRNMVNVDGFFVTFLKTNHRHPIVESILDIYKNSRD